MPRVEERSRRLGGLETQTIEVRRSSHVRPVSSEERITTKRVDLSELARLSAELSAPTPAAPLQTIGRSAVPHLRMPRAEVVQLRLDRNEAFVVSLLDDVSTVAMLVDVAGMAEEVTLATILRLRDRGILDLE